MIFHYWFFNHGSNFQDSICNVSHDLTKLNVNISNIIIIIIDYGCVIYNINKYEAINLLKNSVLEDRGFI